MPGFYDMERADLAELLDGEPPYRLDQVWEGVRAQARRPVEMTSLPVALRSRLEEAVPPALVEQARQVADGGETVKFLWGLRDGAQVESVLMRYSNRVTVCVSTQVGCAMNCSFCATGQAGFGRNLSAGEIVEQVAAALRFARRWPGSRPDLVPNVVFMGMGEPLANYDRLWRAIRSMHEELGISARRMTVSTVGLVPGIRRMAEEKILVNLAVSLHGANDELRCELVPINRRYPLLALAEACTYYFRRTRRRISLEWALIDGVNDRASDAAELVDFARGLRAHVNLIPLNPTPGYPVQGTAPAGVRAFRQWLERGGVNVTVRDTRGSSIDAACGQLAATAARLRACAT